MPLNDGERLWYKNAVFYGVDVGIFQDSDGDGIGDFAGLASRLDYIADLGVTCLWLLPCFPSGGRDNGYDVTDYLRVDPRHGTLEDFLEVVTKAGERGIRVLLDLVVNHTSDEHPWFQAARRDPGSRYHAYYVWADNPPPVPPGKGSIFPGQEQTVWTFDELRQAYYYHRFYHFEPGLNLANEQVREEIGRVMDFWLSFGISGFRLDAASHLVERKGIAAAEPDQPHAILRQLRAFASERRDGAVLLGEADTVPSRVADFFGAGDELNLSFNFLLDNFLFLAFARESAEPIRQVLNMLPAIPHEGHWANFLRNLDEVDLERLSDEQRQEVFKAFAPEPDMRIFGRGIRRRLASMFGGDQQRLQMAYSLLFSMPGSPVIVSGDEIGMGENLELEGRTAVRTPMQWGRGRNGGFSTAPARDLVHPMTAGGPFGYRAVNVEAQRDDEASLLSCVRTLAHARRSAPEIGWGAVHLIDSGDDRVFIHRCEWKGTSLVCVHNLSADALTVSMNLRGHVTEPPNSVLGSATLERSDDSLTYQVRMQRYGYQWLRVHGHPEEIGLHVHR